MCGKKKKKKHAYFLPCSHQKNNRDLRITTIQTEFKKIKLKMHLFTYNSCATQL